MTAGDHVFISYRRDDGGHAGRLYDHLKRTFSASSVYFDAKDLKGGAVYRAELGQAVRTARACLAVIGQQWLSAKNRARLHGPEEDVLRDELRAALDCAEQDATYGLMQVLAGGASPLNGADLPALLAGLADRQAHRLYDEYYDDCVADLIALLERKYAMRRRVGVAEPALLAELPNDPVQLAALMALVSQKLLGGLAPQAEGIPR